MASGATQATQGPTQYTQNTQHTQHQDQYPFSSAFGMGSSQQPTSHAAPGPYYPQVCVYVCVCVCVREKERERERERERWGLKGSGVRMLWSGYVRDNMRD